MRVKVYGSRGSLPIFNNLSLKYGGNTTCLRIYNNNLPKNSALCLDAGSGYLALGQDILKNEPKINNIITLFSHWHHDHIIGLFHSPMLFIKKYFMHLIGPKDGSVGPKEMLQTMMSPPYFPVDIREVRGHFKYNGIRFPGREVIILHNEGTKVMDAEKFEALEQSMSPYISIKKVRYPISECLVVKTFKAKHPDLTISYRLEDRTSGKTMVFLTDHENQDGIPQNMVQHLQGADLLIMDCQYSRKKYDTLTAGYGHATPDYVIKLAKLAGIKRIGLSHHDPMSDDEAIEAIVEEAKSHIDSNDAIEVFACADFMDISI